MHVEGSCRAAARGRPQEIAFTLNEDGLAMDPQVEKILKLPTKQKILILVLVVAVEAAALLYV